VDAFVIVIAFAAADYVHKNLLSKSAFFTSSYGVWINAVLWIVLGWLVTKMGKGNAYIDGVGMGFYVEAFYSVLLKYVPTL